MSEITPNPWIWDPDRRLHYVIPPAGNVRIYEDGSEVAIIPRQLRNHENNVQYGFVEQAVPNQSENYAHAPVGPPTAASDSLGEYHPPGLSHLSGAPLTETIDALPIDHKTRKLGITTDLQNKLDDDFILISNPHGFFTFGRVFRTAWVEPRGAKNPPTSKKGFFGSKTRFEEEAFSKIQWFVVIRTCGQHCLCLSINSHSGKGVGKPGLKKSEHSIIHNARDPIEPNSNEQPGEGEDGMLPYIRVSPTKRGWTMDRMSRLCYSRVYTFEYNLKAKDFGMVHEAYLQTLRMNFMNWWVRDLSNTTPSATGSEFPASPTQGYSAQEQQLLAAWAGLSLDEQNALSQSQRDEFAQDEDAAGDSGSYGVAVPGDEQEAGSSSRPTRSQNEEGGWEHTAPDEEEEEEEEEEEVENEREYKSDHRSQPHNPRSSKGKEPAYDQQRSRRHRDRNTDGEDEDRTVKPKSGSSRDPNRSGYSESSSKGRRRRH